MSTGATAAALIHTQRQKDTGYVTLFLFSFLTVDVQVFVHTKNLICNKFYVEYVDETAGNELK